jgi:hypothetical protein
MPPIVASQLCQLSTEMVIHLSAGYCATLNFLGIFFRKMNRTCVSAILFGKARPAAL